MADIQESKENKQNKNEEKSYRTQSQEAEEEKIFEEEQEFEEQGEDKVSSERSLSDVIIYEAPEEVPTKGEFESEEIFYPQNYKETMVAEECEDSFKEPLYYEKLQFGFGEYEGREKYYYSQESEQGENVFSKKKLGKVEKEENSTSSSQVYSKLSPFFIKWSYGVKTETKMINLTKDNKFEVFYAASHFGVIYDYQRNSMRFLPGHNSHISSIAADESGRWLVTADSGEDSVIIVWDHERRVPSWCLYNIFMNKGTKCVQISPDARFLAAVSEGPDQTFKFYQWTFGREDADGEIKIDPEHGTAIHIQFSHINTSEFAITMERKVMFCIWNSERKSFENIIAEPRKRKGKIGTFVQTLYLDDTHSAITSTTEGIILIWSDTVFLSHAKKEKPGTIMKKYLKSLKVHRSRITSLQLADGIIVSSSEDGIISFHDQTLSLLYWVPKYIFEPVVNVSCNLSQQHGDQLDPFSDDFDDFSSSKRSTSEEEIQDLVTDELSTNGSYEQSSYADEEQKTKTRTSFLLSKTETESLEGLKERQIPSDCTIEMRPFYMRDFIFLTYNGKFGYVSHYRTKVRYFLTDCVAQILSIDCNPNRSHLAAGNSSGRVDLYEHKKKKLLLSCSIANKGITCLKYTPSGHFLTAGLSNGEIVFLDSLLLEVKMKLKAGKTGVVKMCFSQTEKYFAFFDNSNIVYVHEKDKRNQWIFMGAYKSHYKPIKDIIFDEDLNEKNSNKVPRLFSIGEDRMLVEYDMKNLKPKELSLKSVHRIEQTAIPQCMTFLPKYNDKVCFLISNSEYKFKVIERNERICCKTIVGPIAETPVNFMKIIANSEQMPKPKMIYTTEKHIGLRLIPPTGNPFEGTGMFGHPVKITGIAISHDFKYIFTIGLNDNSVLMWKINYKSVDIAHQLGGSGIEPFMPLIEGGKDGFLFREIQDFFYYAQIIHQGEHANLDGSVTKMLALCEIPDFFRSLGYYPTEYEIDNILYEIRHLKFDTTGELVNEVSFDDCLKIYLNHRPVAGISFDNIHKALLTIADLSDPERIIIEREELYKALEERAEAMSHEEVVGYLCILLFPEDEKNPMPGTMTLKDFADDVLGIDLSITEENVKEITHPSEIRNKDLII